MSKRLASGRNNKKTLAFVVNHPFFLVDQHYYAVTPNILDLMTEFLSHVDRVVVAGPATAALEVEAGWERVPAKLEVFELPYYADNLDLIRRSPALLPRLLRRLGCAVGDWNIVGGVAPSGYAMVAVLFARMLGHDAFYYVRGSAMASLPQIYREFPWKRRIVLASFWPLEMIARVTIRLGVTAFTMGTALASQYPGPKVYPLSGYARASVVEQPLPLPVSDLASLRRIMFVGRLSPEKGADILLHALGTLFKEYPEQHATIVGSGPECTALHTIAQEMGIAERLEFTGYIRDTSQLRQLYLRAGIVVVPSRTEGIPVAMIEAMALGRVVVATEVGGIPSVLKHEQNGLLVPPGDPEPLTKALRRLLENPALAFQLAEAAALTGSKLSVESQARQMLDVFNPT